MMTTEEYIMKCKERHGDKFDYSDVVYKGKSERVAVKCKIHGLPDKLPTAKQHFMAGGCRKCAGEKRRLSYSDFIKRSKELYEDAYTYPDEPENFTTDTELEIICKVHGSFKRVVRDHIYASKGKSPCGCPKCGDIKRANSNTKTTERFLKELQLVFGDIYDLSFVEYTKKHLPVKLVCSEHGEFSKPPEQLLNGLGCPECVKETVRQKFAYNTETFIARAREVHGDRFDYSKTIYGKNSFEKVLIGCEKHGFQLMNPTQHLVKTGCPECGKEASKEKMRMTTEEFISRSNEVYDGEYTYEKSVYTGNKDKIVVTCKKHGDFVTNAGNHLSRNGGGCPKCAGHVSYVETELVKRLAEYSPETSNRKVLGGKELDILIGSLAIEVNGVYWHSEKFIDNNAHLSKTEMCAERGIGLLHFWGYEVLEKPDILVSMVKSKLGDSEKIYARNTSAVFLESQKAREFLSKTHLQGADSASTYVGLLHGGEIVAVMSFCKPRFDNKAEVELSRMSFKLNTTIVGGASKMLKFFVKQRAPKTIVTYADRRYSNGEVYTKLGFEFSHNSKPNYFYTGSRNMISRYEAQKHKLPELLGEKFDASLSEVENMKNAGMYRVFDCGNKVFYLTLDNPQNP